MDSPLMLIHGDGEEDIQFRIVLRGASPGLGLLIARNPDEVKVHPIPKLILLDLNLSQPPALEILHWLRSGQPYRQIPLIVLSSPQETSRVDRALELGATSCVLKPVNGEFDGVA